MCKFKAASDFSDNGLNSARQLSRDYMKKFAFLKNKSDLEKRKFLVAENFDENDECLGIYGAVGYVLSFAPREFKKRTLLPPLVVVDFVVVAKSARRKGVGMKLMEEGWVHCSIKISRSNTLTFPLS